MLLNPTRTPNNNSQQRTTEVDAAMQMEVENAALFNF